MGVCMDVCLSVCPFVSNKRQNGWTDRAQILCGTSHDPREGFWIIEFSNIFAIFFCMNSTMYTKRKFYKLNKRWGRSALKAQCVKKGKNKSNMNNNTTRNSLLMPLHLIPIYIFMDTIMLEFEGLLFIP